MTKKILCTEQCLMFRTCFCPSVGIWRNCLSPCVCWAIKTLSSGICHRDHRGGSGVCRATAFPDAEGSRQGLLTIGKIGVWMKKREQHMPAVPLIRNKEWARAPTVLQSRTVSQAALTQAMTKLQFSQPSFTTYCTLAAALL